MAQEVGRSKEESGYNESNRIRGPKVYPNHVEFDPKPDDHSPSTWKISDPRDQERLITQTRSIAGWVKPRTVFEFDLHVENLSRIELGALIWLLSLPDAHFLRLGLGKPLGFGSVRAGFVSDETCVADGTAWSTSQALTDPTSIDRAELMKMQGEFETAISGVNAKVLPSFKRAAEGFAGYPVHYPLLAGQEPGASEHYEWFVANDKQDKRPLPDLFLEDPSLPRIRPVRV